MREPVRFIVRKLGGNAKPGQGLQGRIRVDNQAFVNDAGLFRPVFCSALSILRPARSDDDVRAFLDWTATNGFNGIRVFAGTLLWADQSAERARDRLPFLLDEAAARGLYVEVTSLTDTEHVAIDKPYHVRVIADMCVSRVNTLLELANEHLHQTQDSEVNDPEYLLRLYNEIVKPRGVACAIGAPGDEEWDELKAADYHTHHLERRDDQWDNVRRIREFEELSNILDVPVVNNEPSGADEVNDPGRRFSDPNYFLAMGMLNRLFEVGGVFHFQAGLHAVLPGPVQQTCAEAFVRGSALIPVSEKLQFINGHWADSPLTTALDRTVLRTYTGVAGDRAWSIVLGITGDPEIAAQNGWRIVETLIDAPGLRVLELQR